MLSPEQFAKQYPPGEHEVPVEHLHAIRDPEAVDDPKRAVDLSGGQREPVEIWVTGGYASLADGHHRLQAAMKQGIDKLRAKVHG
jgi:hypothetical protein